MKWFKCVSSHNPAIVAIQDAFGYEGRGMADVVMEIAQQQEISELDINLVSSWLKVQKRKAAKLLPFLQAVLDEFWQINDRKFTENSQKNDRKTVKKFASNASGRNKSIEENRLEEKREEEKEKIQKEKVSSSGKGTRLPEDWRPNDILLMQVKSASPDVNIEREIEKFVTKHLSMPDNHKDAYQMRWDMRFRNHFSWAQENAEKEKAKQPNPIIPPVKAERDPEAWRNDPFWRGCL